jgi:glycosyltransferase involved in cell wall biosynthesis
MQHCCTGSMLLSLKDLTLARDMSPESRPVRVLHIITALGQGGAVRLLADLIAHGTCEVSHQVVSLTDETPFFDLGDTPVALLGLQRGQVSPRALMSATQKVRADAPDIIHAWLYHGNLLSALLPQRRVPLLWSIHNTTLPSSGSRTMTRLINRVCSTLSHWVPWRIAYCAEAARIFHEEACGYNRSRGVVVENGVDFGAFGFDPDRRTAVRAGWGLDSGTLVIGCVGRFDAQKDHETVLAAIRLLNQPRARLVLAGAGCTPDNPQLARLLRAAGIADQTLALGPVHDMRGLLSALDLLVIGSAFGEALPIVGLEAAANDLPLVATAVGNVAELVLDPAHLAPPRDPAALAGAIAAALPRAGGRSPGPCMIARREKLRQIHDVAVTVAGYQRLYCAGAAISRTRRGP